MSTPSQIAANQLNATRSTGPRTPQGKAASSRNATRHGLTGGFRILPNEDLQAYEQLQSDYAAEFAPQTEHEATLLTLLVQSYWKMERIDRLLSEACDQALAAAAPGTTEDAALLQALSTPNPVFDRLERYRATAERAFYRAHRELTQLQRARRRDVQAAQLQAVDRLIHEPLPLLRNEPNPLPRPRPSDAELALRL